MAYSETGPQQDPEVREVLATTQNRLSEFRDKDGLDKAEALIPMASQIVEQHPECEPLAATCASLQRLADDFELPAAELPGLLGEDFIPEIVTLNQNYAGRKEEEEKQTEEEEETSETQQVKAEEEEKQTEEEEETSETQQVKAEEEEETSETQQVKAEEAQKPAEEVEETLSAEQSEAEEAQRIFRADQQERLDDLAGQSGKKGLALLADLEASDLVRNDPELQRFLSGIRNRMNEARNAVADDPQAALVLDEVLNQTDLNLSGRSGFEVFASVDLKLAEKVDSGALSKEAADIIREKLGLQPRKDIKTGGQLKKALRDSVDQNGQSLYIPEKPLVLREGVAVYQQPNGDYIALVNVSGEPLKVKVDLMAGDAVVGQTINTALVAYSLGKRGFIDVIGSGADLRATGDNIMDVDAHFEGVDTEVIISAFLGSAGREEAEILTADDLHSLERYFQILGQARMSQDGNTGELDITNNQQLKEIGFLNPDGSLNQEGVYRIARVIKSSDQKGVLPEWEDLLPEHNGDRQTGGVPGEGNDPSDLEK